jgi:galactokinase
MMTLLRAEATAYGARLMGGGFGGNLLALVKVGSVTQLIERVQRNRTVCRPPKHPVRSSLHSP